MSTKLRAASTPDATDVHEPEDTPTVARRLVVELNRHTASDLAWCVEAEELNKTTVVNRAVQLYKAVIETQYAGGAMILETQDGGAQRYRIL